MGGWGKDILTKRQDSGSAYRTVRVYYQYNNLNIKSFYSISMYIVLCLIHNEKSHCKFMLSNREYECLK